MNERKEIKISLGTAIIIICLIAIIILGLIYFIVRKDDSKIAQQNQNNNSVENDKDTVKKEAYEGKDYYILQGNYEGEYDLQIISLSEYFYSEEAIADKFTRSESMSYEDYKAYCDEWGFKQVYSDENKDYVVYSYLAYGSPNLDVKLAKAEYKNGDIDLYIWDSADGVSADITAYAMVIPTEKTVENINVVTVYSQEEFELIKEYGVPYDPMEMTVKKPIIYLYPTKETAVSVKLLNSEKLTTTYPKYEEGWNVLAKPNGDLTDLKSGKTMYSLYYESKNDINTEIQDGFVVKGEDVSKFMEEKLEVLGLTEREAQEFIIYWLPVLEANQYNYIRFATREEIDANMPLEIEPKPDTTIRVIMIFKGLDEEIKVTEQKLITPERNGFTVVEWGGIEVK